MEADALFKRGWSIAAIACHLGRYRKTVRSYLSGDRVAGVRRSSVPGPLGPFAAYVKARFVEDPHLWASAAAGVVPGTRRRTAFATPADGAPTGSATGPGGATVEPADPGHRAITVGKPRTRRARRLGAATAVALVVSAIAIVAVVARPWAPTPSPNPVASATGVAVAYDFDGNLNVDALGVRQVPDSAGHGHSTAARTDQDGHLIVVPHPGQGNAVKFPTPCPQAPAVSCPGAVTQTNGSDLDPDARDFSYRADLLVGATDVISLNNVIEKGSETGPTASGWRLDIESTRRPSRSPRAAVSFTGSDHPKPSATVRGITRPAGVPPPRWRLMLTTSITKKRRSPRASASGASRRCGWAPTA